MSPAEVAAREALRDLVAAYAHAADRGRFDEVADLFEPDGILEFDDGRRMEGRAAIRAFLADTGDALRADTARPLVRHHVSSHRLVVDGPARAHGWAYFLVVTERGPDHWGRYRDAYAASDAMWRFHHRRVRVDGWLPGSWAARRRVDPA